MQCKLSNGSKVAASVALVSLTTANMAPNPLFTYTGNLGNDAQFNIDGAAAQGPGGGLMLSTGDTSTANGSWPDITGLDFSLASFVVFPCSGVAPHIHSDATEFNTVIQGEAVIGTFGVNGGPLMVNKVSVGDSFAFPQGSMHFWVNTGNTTLATVGGFTASQPTTSMVLPFVTDMGSVSSAFGLNGTTTVTDVEGLETLFPTWEANPSQCADFVASAEGLILF
eukprot:CFRG4019T1